MPDARSPAPATLTEEASVEPAGVEVVAEVQDTAAAERKRWKKAVVIVGSHKVPADKPSIVVEQRTATVEKVEGQDDKVTLHEKKDGYPANADIYLGYVDGAEFPKGAKQILRVGENIRQGGLWGFNGDPRLVNVGPASLAYAGANLAWQRGAEEIEIIGLSDAEKERLAPYIAKLPTDPTGPAQVKITLS